MMRKSILLIIAVLAILAVPIQSSAFHVIGEEMKTKLQLRVDFISPEDSDSFVEQRTSAHFQKGDLGFGGEVRLVPEFDSIRFRPYVTVNTGPITPIIGFSTDDNGVDHLDAGIWYYRQLGDNLSVFLDLRNFWGLNNDSDDFTDNFVAIAWTINSKFFAGLDLAYDYWWKSKDDWYLVGIPLGYSLTEDVTVVVRPTFDRFLPEEGDDTDAYSLKAVVNIAF